MQLGEQSQVAFSVVSVHQRKSAANSVLPLRAADFFGGNSVTRNALFLPCSYAKAS